MGLGKAHGGGELCGTDRCAVNTHTTWRPLRTPLSLLLWLNLLASGLRHWRPRESAFVKNSLNVISEKGGSVSLVCMCLDGEGGSDGSRGAGGWEWGGAHSRTSMAGEAWLEHSTRSLRGEIVGGSRPVSEPEPEWGHGWRRAVPLLRRAAVESHG